MVSAQASGAHEDSDGLRHVNHIIVVMQENHSFDNYFGALPYMNGGHYHPPSTAGGPCHPDDHECVDGLTCSTNAHDALKCTNSNPGANGVTVTVFHEKQYCTLNPPHEWVEAHREANFENPNSPIVLADGFARMRPSDATAMGYYTAADLPYYYALAQTFALSDAHFSSLFGPTMPNRSYLMAATSFGHVLTSKADNTPPTASGYRPITGTVFDLFDKFHADWAEYFEPGDNRTPPRPYGALFRPRSLRNFRPLSRYFEDARIGRLPGVAFISLAQHEHPPLNVRAGEYYVAKVVTALRDSPNWKDSILFLTYDEYGGYYDHAKPPLAPSPDHLSPGRCADLNDPPRSRIPGNGSGCELSAQAQRVLCAMAGPGHSCADFVQFGFRDPLIAVSPFARPHYVSHVPNDQTSILALIEKRFLGDQHLTARDSGATSLEDMFDFNRSPSVGSAVARTLAPAPTASDPGCRRAYDPFSALHISHW
jgi:phospholipase C